MNAKEFENLKERQLLVVKRASGSSLVFGHQFKITKHNNKIVALLYSEIIYPEQVRLATMDDVIKAIEEQQQKLDKYKASLYCALAANGD